jgi:hypothetical protein
LTRPACTADLARWLTHLPEDLDGDKLFAIMRNLDGITQKKVDALMADRA